MKATVKMNAIENWISLELLKHKVNILILANDFWKRTHKRYTLELATWQRVNLAYIYHFVMNLLCKQVNQRFG